MKTRLWLCAALVIALGAGCSRPAPPKPAEPAQGKHEYRELKAETYPVPESVKQALPGLLNDKVYLYREVAPTLNLVAYVPDYSRLAAVQMAAQAFIGLADDPEFRRGIDFWIIQVQPKPVEPAPGAEAKPGPVLVWGVRPSEVDAYRTAQDLAGFLKESEYLLVDDKIIEKGEPRLVEVPELRPPEPLAGATAAPAPGATVPAAGTTAPTISPAPVPAPAPAPAPVTP